MKCPPVLHMRIRLPLWLEDTPLSNLKQENQLGYPISLPKDFSMEIYVPEPIQTIFTHVEMMKWIEKLSIFASKELENFIDEKAKNRKTKGNL